MSYNPSTMHLFREITTLSFDADQTLWNFQQTMYNGLRHALNQLRDHVPSDAVDAVDGLSVQRLIAIRDEVATEMQAGMSHEEIRLRAFERTLEEIDAPDSQIARRVTDSYLTYRFQHALLYPEVVPTLDVLRRYFRLGIVSNGNSYPAACGLGGYFDFEIFSFRCGVAKPDPAIFKLACAEAGCCPQQLLHVGDSLENDVACSQQIEVRSVWLNRNGDALRSGFKPDATIQTLGELIRLLVPSAARES